jgi:hypothetical protein
VRRCSTGSLFGDLRRLLWSTTFEPALLKRVKNFSFHGCIRVPMGDPPGPAVPQSAARRRFAAGSEEVARPQRTIRGEGGAEAQI